MAPWYLPTHTRTLLQRWVSLRTVLMVLAGLALLITEFRFNWVESVTGRYLVSTNAARPQSGAIWDQGLQSLQARKTLASFVDQRRAVQSEARQAATLGQVVEGLNNGDDAMISAAHFVELYLKLPPVLGTEMVSPYAILSRLSDGKWQRVYFDRQSDQLLIFFLDSDNQVLDRLSIGTSLLAHIQRGEVAINGRLEQLSDLAVNIYSADRFFSVLNSLPAHVRQSIIPHPQDLLRVSGNLVRVGISDRHQFDSVDLGFEIASAHGFRVILIQGQLEAVRQVQRRLIGKAAPRWQQDWEDAP
jgi:hypothetical protein